MKDIITKSNRAFTLVEVTMSLGIVAFAFVALIGLLPVTLTSFKDSRDSTIKAQIMNDVSGTVSLTDFSKINVLNNAEFYFDFEGLSLAAKDENAIYVATLRVSENPNLPANGAHFSGQSLRSVQVSITSRSDGARTVALSTRTLLASDNGR